MKLTIRMCRYCLCLCLALPAVPVQALPQKSVAALALRVQQALSSQTVVEALFSARWQEFFDAHDRGIAQVSVSQRYGNSELNLAYQVQFARNGARGVEQRLSQQLRHLFPFQAGSYELSGKLEERYFSHQHSGKRLRILNRWNHPLSGGRSLSVGHEWLYNLDDLSANTQRGLSQNRLIFGLQNKLASGRRLDLEYQIRLLHALTTPDTVQHQLQLQYVLNL